MDAKWSKSSKAAHSFFLVPILIGVERQSMQLLASPGTYLTNYILHGMDKGLDTGMVMIDLFYSAFFVVRQTSSIRA